ncbi:MAG TPA: transketolase [Ktedonobacterales bacterium]|nr:transketolase [Ktedonobacterales bacterium]
MKTRQGPKSLECGVTAQNVARIVLEQSHRAHVGHIGSCLSVATILATLYRDVLRIPSLVDPDRDRFILSKGHAALALYATLFLRGDLTAEELNSFHMDGSLLGVHPDRALAGVDFSTGSLGHGLSFGAGAALAARMQRSSRRVFVLLSDAECNEGSVWEAIMFAAHHRLANLVAIIDANSQQALGYTADIMHLSPLAERWRAFRWDAHEVDGHDADEIKRVIATLDTVNGQPHVLVANTVFGKGVTFMERQIAWHYLPMTAEQFEVAMREIERMS